MLVTALLDDRMITGEIHATSGCRAILAREANGYDDSDYHQIEFRHVPGNCLACQFPECFQGMLDADAIRRAGYRWITVQGLLGLAT